jgi:hypothetical protein
VYLSATRLPLDWYSPTGFSDPDSAWTWEDNAYDNDDDSYAYSTSSASSYLILTRNQLKCDKIKILCTSYITAGSSINIFIDIYYSGEWHNIYNDKPSYPKTWNIIDVGSEEWVTQARIIKESDAHTGIPKIYEFYFHAAKTASITTAATIFTGVYHLSGATACSVTTSAAIGQNLYLSGTSACSVTTTAAIGCSTHLSGTAECSVTISAVLDRTIDETVWTEFTKEDETWTEFTKESESWTELD